MSRQEQKTESIICSIVIAGVDTSQVFRVRGGLIGAAIQVNVVEVCLSVASAVDECISVACNSLTVASHGFVTGLKGTISACIGCVAVTPSACISVACNLITEACHGFTAGERGRFTTSCTLPSFCGCVISACTDFFVIALSAGTYNVATTRALALAGTGVCITGAGVGCQTFTPNGASPTGLSTCTGASFIIRIDDCTFKIATSRANAIAGTVDPITALQSPAATLFTAVAPGCDCLNGSISFHSSVDCSNFAVANLGCVCIKLRPDIAVDTVSVFACAFYNSIQIDIDVLEGQWIISVDASAK